MSVRAPNTGDTCGVHASTSSKGCVRAVHHRFIGRVLGTGALLLLLLPGCMQQASETSLDELARNPLIYHGYPVSAAGELKYHPDPLHYWIESTSGTRVEVLGLKDPELLLGAQIRVMGTFRYSRDRGRRIEVENQARLP